MVQKNQKELTEILQHSKTVAFLGHMNSILEKNGDTNGKEGYMVGKGVSSSILLRFISLGVLNISLGIDSILSIEFRDNSNLYFIVDLG